MFKNYFILALRNILKHRLYSAINIVGLAVGLASCILIMLYVHYELTFDKFYPNKENIYLVQFGTEISGDFVEFQRSPGTYRDPIIQEVPEVVNAARLYTKRNTLQIGENQFSAIVRYVDANYFDIFNLPMKDGSRIKPLTDRNAILLSETAAKRFFGDEPVIGKVFTLDGLRDYKVAGIIKDSPIKSHVALDVVVLLVPEHFTDQPWVMQQWGSATVRTYVQLRDGTDPAIFDQAMPALLDKFRTDTADRKASEVSRLSLLNIQDIHMKGADPEGNMTAVVTFSAIAGLILIIAGINFTNLSTARSLQRAREIGMRKVLGAQRSQIISQFLLEAISVAFLALLVAFTLVEVCLPLYREFIGREIVLDYFGDGLLIPGALAITLLVGIIGGLYPAIVLSSFKPSEALKANSAGSAGGKGKIRSGLVVVQFAISMALMICTAVVYAQLDFAQNSDVGFNKEDKLLIRNIWQGRIGEGKSEALKVALLRNPDILSVTRSFEVPGSGSSMSNDFRISNGQDLTQMNLSTAAVDFDFFKTYQIPLIAGRAFSIEYAQDQNIYGQQYEGGNSVIINETAARRLGFITPQDALNKTFEVFTQNTWIHNIVVGVVPDIHYRSFHNGIRPMVYASTAFSFNDMTLHFRAGTDKQKLVKAIEATWATIVPDHTIRTNFFDEFLEAQYNSDRQAGQLFFIFAALAILIACLGLYGLAAFNAQTRTKEIGIRKVLGATVIDIVKLLVWQFSKPVIIANIIAWPVAFYVMRDYLNGFQYRIDIHPGYFITASVAALLIAWATVTWHAAKVASAKPINALRHE